MVYCKKMKKGGRFLCDNKYKSICNQGSPQTIQKSIEFENESSGMIF